HRRSRLGDEATIMRRFVSRGVLVLLLTLVPSTGFAPGRVSSTTSLAPVEVVASRLRGPVGVAVEQAGSIVVSQGEAGSVTRITTDGRRSTVVTGLDHPMGLAVDHQGRLLIVEEGRGRLWQ